MDLLRISDSLAGDLERLTFSAPVAHVYNPLLYARKPNALYLDRYGNGGKEVVFVGMNPGPWGMAQTGVPFGEISMVREWLCIEEDVGKPRDEHPKKMVTGFSCRRSEVSGRRLWGMFRARFAEAASFFERFFVLNYCPLLFLDASGRNLTPNKLQRAERELLLAVCDRALHDAIVSISPGRVIGVGNFAAERAEAALAGLAIPVGKILHPSPSNPTANRNWEETALRQLKEQGIEF